jgi:alcohol dehydrogenase class IV
MDLAKAAAGLFNSKDEISAYHNGLAIETPGIPFVAMPTTAGTGSEATVVSVLINSDTNVKKSIRHPSFMARLVILDPDLLSSCAKHVIAHSGMDAFTQAIESYTSTKAVWLSDSLSLKGLEMIASSLEEVYKAATPESLDSLLTGSYLAGIALSFSRLGVVHGLAHPLGARYHQPHGLVCALCLPHTLELNKEAIDKKKYDALCTAVDCDIIIKTRQLIETFKIESPFMNKELIDRETIIEETLASGSTAANPKPISRNDVELLLEKLFKA